MCLNRQPARLTEVCIPCRRAFADRLSWSGHAARKHGYRSHAFLCAQGNTCLACGKQFSSTGRLRRHLYAKDKCIKSWGSFQPDGAQPRVGCSHSQAPPHQLSGVFDSTAAAGVNTEVAWGLLQDLRSRESVEEEDVWEAVTSYVEPLDVLRATVKAWASLDDADHLRRATADNILLLLDVELLADHAQPKSMARAFPQDNPPAWADPGKAAFVITGDAVTFKLMPPPTARLDFAGPTSMRLREAIAYSTWLESGCALLARALETSRTNPVVLACPALDSALGPASNWLKKAGFHIDASGLASPKG